MKIIEIYDKYFIPPVLRTHMLRVAKVALYIHDHWKGQTVDKDKLILLCLVHDLGNIVRMDFDKPLSSEDDVVDVTFWKNKKNEIINKYGDNDDEVMVQMLRELSIDDELVQKISAKSFKNSTKIEQSPDWLLKILHYSDLRVLPTHIGRLEERLDEVLGRRKDLSGRKDIQSNTNISLDTIDENDINISESELLNFEI